MRYSDADLQEYWSDVKNGGVLSNAAPNSFQNTDTFTQGQQNDLQDIKDTSYADRNAAMNWTDRYKPVVEQANSLSSTLDSVLDKNSHYIQRARTKSNEAASARGLLNSSMAAGAAEGAAIDRGLQIAQGDVDVNRFNVGNTNAARESRYKTAGTLANTSQDFQNKLGAAEAGHIFDTATANQKQAYQKENDQLDFLFKQQLANNKHAQDMEKDMLQYTNTRAIEMLKQQSGLYAQYLNAYGDIASADISQADKFSQLQNLGRQITNAVAATRDYQDIVISGAPYFGIGDVNNPAAPPPAATSTPPVTPPTGLPAGISAVESSSGVLGNTEAAASEPTPNVTEGTISNGSGKLANPWPYEDSPITYPAGVNTNEFANVMDYQGARYARFFSDNNVAKANLSPTEVKGAYDYLKGAIDSGAWSHANTPERTAFLKLNNSYLG